MSSTLRTLADLSRIPVQLDRRGEPQFGTFSDYVLLGGRRIFVRVHRGAIIEAVAPPLAGNPLSNPKWIAGEGRVS